MNISRTRRAFENKEKAFFLVSKKLFFRYKKQNSNNISDVTFKESRYFCNSNLWIRQYHKQYHKMVRHTQTICRDIADELFECVWPFLGLALKGLMRNAVIIYFSVFLGSVTNYLFLFLFLVIYWKIIKLNGNYLIEIPNMRAEGYELKINYR